MKSLRFRSPRSDAVVQESISHVLAEALAALRIEHCRLDVAEFAQDSGTLTLRIEGGCPDCDLSPATFITAIEAHLRQRVPEVREVRVEADTSPSSCTPRQTSR